MCFVVGSVSRDRAFFRLVWWKRKARIAVVLFHGIPIAAVEPVDITGGESTRAA